MLMTQEEQKPGLVTRALRKAATRARLGLMAEAARAATPADPAARKLARVRDYLREWADWQASYFPTQLTGGRGAGWVSSQSSATSASEYLERADELAMRAVNLAVEEGLALYPDGVAMRIALRVRWLNEKVGASVFRASRLAGRNTDDLADRAERTMVELLERRGLPLD